MLANEGSLAIDRGICHGQQQKAERQGRWGSTEATGATALGERNRKGLVLSQALMVIECHTLPSDSVILALRELDECIGHISRTNPVPLARGKMFMPASRDRDIL